MSPSHLEEMWQIKETLPKSCVLCQEVIDPCPSPGVLRETLSTLTPHWPPPCWGLRPASSWYPQWTITIVESTPVELRTQLGCPLTQLNSKSMVIFGCTERYFIYRTSSNCSFFLWWLSCQPRRVSTTDVCSQSRGQTPVYNMESEGRHCILWSHPHYHHVGHTSQHVGHIISRLSALWGLYLQGWEYSWDIKLLC